MSIVSFSSLLTFYSSVLNRCARWHGVRAVRTETGTRSPAHIHLLSKLLRLGLDPSQFEHPSRLIWPRECSPNPVGRIDDPFFTEWVSEIIKVSPGECLSSLLQNRD